MQSIIKRTLSTIEINLVLNFYNRIICAKKVEFTSLKEYWLHEIIKLNFIIQSPQSSLIKGRQHCPSFSIDKEILIPNGARREITIEVRNLVSSLVSIKNAFETK